MAWCWTGDRSLSKVIWPSSVMYIYMYAALGGYELTYHGPVMRHCRSGSTLDQVMACLVASHYLDQCWLGTNINHNSHFFIEENAFENVVCKMSAIFKRGPSHWWIFARNSNPIKTLPCCNSIAGYRIATNLCTCHDSTAVMACTKLCSDHYIKIKERVKRNFHKIWIAMEKH